MTSICKFDWSNHCVWYSFCSIVCLTDLRSKYPAGVKSEPKLSDLMNEVAAVIPDKWQQVGIVLNVSDGDLASFIKLDSHTFYFSFHYMEEQTDISIHMADSSEV